MSRRLSAELTTAHTRWLWFFRCYHSGSRQKFMSFFASLAKMITILFAHAFHNLNFMNRRHDVSVPLAQYARRNFLMTGEGCNCYCGWEPVGDMKVPVMQRFFEVQVGPEQTCELFLIEGVPAASMVYNETNMMGSTHCRCVSYEQGTSASIRRGSTHALKTFQTASIHGYSTCEKS